MYDEEYFQKRSVLEAKHIFEVEEWINYFGLRKGDKVFDFGCGLGQRIHVFREHGIDAWGCEESEYAIANGYGLAKGKILNDIPIDTKFNLVISVDVFEHIEDIDLEGYIEELSEISNLCVFGITFGDSKNFPLDKTHINGKTQLEWYNFLEKFYGKVYPAPQWWVESHMYFICYR